MRAVPALILLLVSETASATVGGPQSIELLGWDRVTSSVWYLEHHHDESDEKPILFRLPLATRRAVAVSWARPYSDSSRWNRAHARRYQRILARLRPLVELAPSDVAVEVRGRECPGCPIRVRVEGPSVRPANVRVRDVRGDHDAVRLTRLVGVPGRADVLAVIRWFGVDDEAGYTKQAIIQTRSRSPVMPARSVQVRLEVSENHLDLSWSEGSDMSLVRVYTPDWDRCTDERQTALDDMPYALGCGGDVVRVFRDPHALRMMRGGDEVARLSLPAAWSFDAAVVDNASSQAIDDDLETRCRRDGDCRVLHRGRGLIRVPERGQMRCRSNHSKTVCLFEHATMSHLQRAFLIESGSVQELTLPNRPHEAIESWSWADSNHVRFRMSNRAHETEVQREVVFELPSTD